MPKKIEIDLDVAKALHGLLRDMTTRLYEADAASDAYDKLVQYQTHLLVNILYAESKP